MFLYLNRATSNNKVMGLIPKECMMNRCNVYLEYSVVYKYLSNKCKGGFIIIIIIFLMVKCII